MWGFIKVGVLLSIVTAIGCIMAAIPTFIVLWFVGSWETAQTYTITTAIIVCLLCLFFSPNDSLGLNDTTGKNAFIGLALLGTVIYGVTFAGKTEKSQVLAAKVSNITTKREPSCYDIGLKYGSVAYGSMQGKSYATDVVIPERCRGDKMTNLGIKNAIKYSQ